MNANDGRTHDLIDQLKTDASMPCPELAARLRPLIAARVRRALSRRHLRAELATGEAEDLGQEVWLVLIKDDARQLRAFDPARGASIRGYLAMVVDRVIGNELQKKRAKKRAAENGTGADVDLLFATDPSPEEHTATRDLFTTLERHMARVLPERGRRVFHEVVVRERTPEEAGRVLGFSVQVIYNWQLAIRREASHFLALHDIHGNRARATSSRTLAAA